MLQKKQLETILRNIKLERNPISIISTEFLDFDLEHSLTDLGYMCIRPTNEMSTWTRFVRWFYSISKNSIVGDNNKRIFLVNTDDISRIPKNEKSEKAKNKETSVYKFINYCKKLKDPVLLFTESIEKHRIQGFPLKFGDVKNKQDLQYVSEFIVSSRKSIDDKKSVLYNYNGSMDSIVHFITDNFIKCSKNPEDAIKIIETYFKLHRLINRDELIDYVARMFNFGGFFFLNYPKQFKNYFKLAKNEPSVLKYL